MAVRPEVIPFKEILSEYAELKTREQVRRATAAKNPLFHSMLQVLDLHSQVSASPVCQPVVYPGGTTAEKTDYVQQYYKSIQQQQQQQQRWEPENQSRPVWKSVLVPPLESSLQPPQATPGSQRKNSQPARKRPRSSLDRDGDVPNLEEIIYDQHIDFLDSMIDQSGLERLICDDGFQSRFAHGIANYINTTADAATGYDIDAIIESLPQNIPQIADLAETMPLLVNRDMPPLPIVSEKPKGEKKNEEEEEEEEDGFIEEEQGKPRHKTTT